MRDQASTTAEAVCLFRARETLRDDDVRVLSDPYAQHFLGPMGRAGLATWRVSGKVGAAVERAVPGLASFAVSRHRFIDDALLAALKGDIEQVVICGAGYDARAWRLADALAGRPIFEVDHPATAARKRALVAGLDLPEVDRRVAEIDFQTRSGGTQTLADRLPAAGFSVGAPTFFVWEGVTMYLRRAAVQGTLEALAALGGPGSELALDSFFLPEDGDIGATVSRMATGFFDLLSEPLLFAMHPEDMPDFLARHGWAATDVVTAAGLESRYIRDGRRVYPTCYVVSAQRAG